MYVGEECRDDGRDQRPQDSDQETARDAGPRRRRQAQQDAAAGEAANPQPQGLSPAEAPRHPIAEQADQDDAGGDGARMQADGAIAEGELRLQEGHDIALHVDGVDVEAGQQPGVPRRRPAQGGGDGRVSGCVRAHPRTCQVLVVFSI